MELIKKGNTEELSIHLTRNGQEIDIDDVAVAHFTIDTLEKEYPSENVSYDSETFCFIIKLSQQETLDIKTKKEIKWEAGIRYTDGETKRTHTNKIPVEETLFKEVI